MESCTKNQSRYFVGIDPGARGAVAVIHPDGNVTTFALDEQDDFNSSVHYFLQTLPADRTLACIEDLHAIYGASAASTFSLGWACGYWHGVLNLLGVAVTVVKPIEWQKAVTTPVNKAYIPRMIKHSEARKMREAHKKAIKAESIRAANEMFPEAKVEHDGIADALCIAAYLRRVYNASNLLNEKQSNEEETHGQEKEER